MTSWRAHADIPATSIGPSAARHIVIALLEAWGLLDLVDDAAIIVSELVANSWRHAPGTDSFELEITQRPAGVRISLADGSAIRPVIRELSDDAPSGRGMTIVEALSAGWGAEDHLGGKRVWIDLDRPLD